MFAQVRGLECIDLGDRRSRVQISAARQTNRNSSRNHDDTPEVSGPGTFSNLSRRIPLGKTILVPQSHL